MSAFDVNDSIAAIASPPGPAVRGVVRLSGPDIDQALGHCFISDEGREWSLQRRPVVLAGQLRIAAAIDTLPVLLHYWPTTASYTRQRSAEIHCCGSPAVLDEVVRTLGQFGVRQAQPGEFTMRAFLAGRIDLTRAEAVLGVIDSQSEQEMDVALRQLSGGLSGPLTQLQDDLLETLAHIEAGLDFVEEDIEFIAGEQVLQSIEAARQELGRIIDRIDQRHVSSVRRRVVLLGRPNAGKSCLQNVLAGRSAALVSDIPGTTRDYLICETEISGYAIELIDTAGTLRESTESLTGTGASHIQQQAEYQADQVIRHAHLKVLCLDGSRPLDAWDRQQLNELSGDERLLAVRTKSDLPQVWNHPNVVTLSSLSGTGLDQLRGAIAQRLDAAGSASSLIVASTAVRCFESLSRAREELTMAADYQRSGAGEEIVAAALRNVLDELAVTTGKVFTDDILDRVFSRFCIGK